jgi:pimeloyl-ACP methyl ester carboxylesterase
MKALRIFGYALATFVIALVIGTLIALWAYRDIPAEDLEAKYASPTSRFMNIDGVRIHYRDEGQSDGPAILLLHANFGNLIGWDPWVEALKDTYRVVRIDFTSHGLTGPDPTGDYTLERTLYLLERFVDAVGLDEFSIAGTSMGGTMAMLYSHAHPNRIQNLILLSPGSLEGREQKARGDVPDSAYVLTYILPRALPEFMLLEGFGDDSKLTEELIDRWYDMWMREGQRRAQLDRLRQYESGDTLDAIRALTPPTLLLWGEENHTAHFEQAYEFQTLLGNVESLEFISYPGVGHMAVQEAGAETGRDVRTFLDARRAATSEAEE